MFPPTTQPAPTKSTIMSGMKRPRLVISIAVVAEILPLRLKPDTTHKNVSVVSGFSRTVLAGPFCAGELLHTSGGHVDDMVEAARVNLPRRKYDDERARRGGRHHRPRRVGRGISERTPAVRKRDAPAHVDVVLADAWIRLPLLAQSQHDVAFDLRGVIQPVRKLKLQ